MTYDKYGSNPGGCYNSMVGKAWHNFVYKFISKYRLARNKLMPRSFSRLLAFLECLRSRKTRLENLSCKLDQEKMPRRTRKKNAHLLFMGGVYRQGGLPYKKNRDVRHPSAFRGYKSGFGTF